MSDKMLENKPSLNSARESITYTDVSLKMKMKRIEVVDM